MANPYYYYYYYCIQWPSYYDFDGILITEMPGLYSHDDHNSFQLQFQEHACDNYTVANILVIWQIVTSVVVKIDRFHHIMHIKF